MSPWNLFGESPVVVVLHEHGLEFLAIAVFELGDGRAVWVRDDWADTARAPFHVTESEPLWNRLDGTWHAGDAHFFRLDQGGFGGHNVGEEQIATPERVMEVLRERPGLEFLAQRGITEREWVRGLVEEMYGKGSTRR